jgi:Zn-dependent protease
MLDKITQIAPLGTWGLILGSALLLLCGFVAFGHAKVTSQAYKEPFRGGLAAGVLETMMRLTVALVGAGVLLWGISLRWPTAVLAALGGVVAAVLLLEAVARVRG